jgi:Cell Wall Hydrolase
MSDSTGMTDADLFGQPAPPVVAAPSASTPAAPAAPSIPPLPNDTDQRLIARAVLAEADPNNPQSQFNVAGVILNRMQKTGKTASEILSEPGQFESYQNGHIQGVDTTTPQFGAALNAAQMVQSGKVQVPYDSFYNPSIVSQRGVKPPFDAKDGTMIGTQVFGNAYGGGSGSNLTPQQQAEWERISSPDPGVTDAITGQPLTNPAQIKAARDAQARGEIDVKAPPGSSSNPFYLQPTDDLKNLPAGAFYWDQQGNQKVNAPVSNPLVYGLEHGAGAIPATVGNALKPVAAVSDNPAAVSELAGVNQGNALQQGQFNNYVRGGDAALGNVAGQMGTAIPLGVAGEEGLAAIPAVGDFLAGRAGSNLLTQGLSRATAGALQGGGTAAALSSTSNAPLAQQVEQGALTGGVAGPAIPILAKGAGMGVNALTGASDVSPAISALADKAINQYGIPLSKPQILAAGGDRGAGVTWSNMLSEPGSGMMANLQAQHKAFTKAVAGTFGEDADALTPQAMQGAKDRIGGVFQRVGQNTTITDTDPLLSNLGTVVHEAQQVLPDSEVAPLLKQVENIGSTIKDGTLSGDSYLALTRKGSALDNAQQSPNAAIRYYAGQIRDALDGALEDHASPQDLSDLQNARWQYKNLMTVKDLAAKAGVDGNISPTLLSGQVNKSFKNRAFSGAGDLGDLSQIGQAFMREPPNSGSPARIADMVKRNLVPLGLEGGAGLAAAMHQPGLIMPAVAGGAVVGATKLGSNALYGAMNGPSAAARLVSGNPGIVGNLLQGGSNLAGRISQGAYIPASVAYNRLLSVPASQAVPGSP